MNFATLAERVTYENAKTDDKMTSANIKKLDSAHALFTSENVAALMLSCSVDVSKFAASNVYTISKIDDVLRYAQKAQHDLNEMTRCVFLSALNFTTADVTFTRDNAKDACSASRKLHKSVKALTVQNAKNVADSTVNAQHASSLDALVSLNVLDYANKSYRVNVENEIAKALIERLTA